jgi:hypothetical protein
MENKMEENKNDIKEEIQISMKEMQNSMSSMIFQALDERLPKGDIKMQGTHENKCSIHVEQTANNNLFSTSESNSNSGVNYGGGPKFNFPKIELKKFDGTKVFTWVNQLEQYFELHDIMDAKKRIHIATLNFEIKPYQWYQWIVKRKPPLYHYTWGLFTRDLEAQYGKVWEVDYFNQLTRIKHLGDIEDYNSEFQVLSTRVDDISDQQLLESYMDGLKQDIKHEIFLRHPTNIMESMQNDRHIQAKNKATHKYTIGAYTSIRDHFVGHKTNVPQQMIETREKGLCFNCDNKYSKGHKCGDNKLFYIDCEEEEDSVPQPTRLKPQQMDERREKGLCFNGYIK